MAAHNQSRVARTQHRSVSIEQIAAAGLILVVLVLTLANLPYAPRSWYDEGSHLHVPKTLVQDGRYADRSVALDGTVEYRYHGPTIGVGPTVMLPVALAFELFGVGLVQGRLVIVGYLLLALLGCYMLARRMHGRGVALLATLLLLASRTTGYEGAVEYGRQVLGEIPGVAFMFLGALAWLAALEHTGARRRWLAALAGLGFGLALVTKNQFVLIIPPALALLALLDWRYYRAGCWTLRLVPPVVAGACFAAWTLAQLTFLGAGTFWENVQATRQAAGGAIFVFNLRSTLRAGAYLLRPDLYGGLLVPALAYGLWRARTRDARGLAEALLVLLIGLWLAWFVFVSLGWPRYAFPAVALGAIVVARASADLLAWLWAGGRGRRAAAALAGLYLGTALVLPLARTTRYVFSPDDSAQRFAATVSATVPSDALVATWEQELGLLTDHRYQYPPQQLLDQAVRRQWLGGPPVSYAWHVGNPEFVALGPFGDYTGIFDTPVLATQYQLIEQAGPYRLYMRR